VNHPALDAFGDLQAAARDPHVATCAQCQTELATQQQVHDLLTSLPDPGPVPAEVVERIETTLRDLARGPQPAMEPSPVPNPVPSPVPSTETPEPTTTAATVVPLESAPSARRRRPWMAVAAAAAVLVGGGVVVSQLLPPSSGSDSSSAGAALQDKSAASRGLSGEAAGEVRAIASGTNYTRAKIASQVDQAQGQATDSATGLLGTPAGLAGCLSALGTPSARPQLVDLATFEGKPAAVIVLPGQDGGREIWVVSPTCSPGKDGLRYFTAVR
jgi:hypothetical protein